MATKSLLRTNYGTLVNLEQAAEFKSTERNGVRTWHVAIGTTRMNEFCELSQPFEFAFITKWVEARLALEQPRNALGQFEQSSSGVGPEASDG